MYFSMIGLTYLYTLGFDRTSSVEFIFKYVKFSGFDFGHTIFSRSGSGLGVGFLKKNNNN